MAQLIRVDGTTEEVPWTPGGNNDRVLRMLFPKMIDTAITRDGRLMIVDDTGLIEGLSPNPTATELYGRGPIAGDVIVLTHEETRADMAAL